MEQRQTIKSHLLVQDKYLGSLLYFKDAAGRGCLKLAFGNKIEGFVKSTDVPTTLPVPLKLEVPMSLDVSYKFEDSLLEVKKLIDGKIEREFYKVPLPVENPLFIIKVKDWHTLDDDKASDSPLVLTPPSANPSVAIIFTFLGENGLPFKPPQYDCPEGMGTIDLPEQPLDKFSIGIAEDPNNASTNGFEILIPYPKQNL